MGGVRIQDYPTAGYVRIEGINYSYEFFKDFARGVPLNTPFKITRRDNEKLCVERIKESPAPAPVPVPVVEKEIKVELPAGYQTARIPAEVEAKLDTDEVPQVYKRNVGRPRRHKMIEEAPEAKD
jgi:hypothetical protein